MSSSSANPSKQGVGEPQEDPAARLTTTFSSLAAKRDLRRALVRSTNPAKTIQTFQLEHSLHTMIARAFQTTPMHEMKKTRSQEQQTVEPLDSDAAIAFLSHLHVRQYDVHKRISDTLMKQLETEIRKATSNDALLKLLQSCWTFATTLPELRPVLWAVLRQLGEGTPLPVLQALAERDNAGKLKYGDVFEPLPPLLKRLCWEADWESHMTRGEREGPGVLKVMKTTLLYETVTPLIELYCQNKTLVDSSDRMFVSTVRELRLLTKQRRALVSTGVVAEDRSGQSGLDSGKAISQLRSLLCDTVGTTTMYRPKLLNATLSMLMAQHGSELNGVPFGGASHLRCSMVADILLSAGGPLPREYQSLMTLARTLDDCVQEGTFSNAALIKVQDSLRQIFLVDDDQGSSATPVDNQSSHNPAQQPLNEELSLSTLRQLNKIITAGIDAMKDADPQSLFLNPVTDDIAPGYSKIISKPMSVMHMEAKVAKNKYKTVEDWEKDVKLMFKNCVDYNRGAAGQWFRGEAQRQGKVFRDEIFPQARRLFQAEIAKRRLTSDESADRKRKMVEEIVEVAPLPAATKKMKKSAQDDDVPSMPALASMLIADPFVIRIILARLLRDLRRGVINGTSIPVAHAFAPSLLQLLHLARWSKHVCAVSGKRYLIPESGLEEVEAGRASTGASFSALRHNLPLLLRLFIEAELDRRIHLGGDLHEAALSVNIPVDRLGKDTWVVGDQMEVLIALFEGVITFLCQPGLGNESSLAITFPKFADNLQFLSPSLCCDYTFFACLSNTLLRHKAKLPRGTRDAIVHSWLGWLRADVGGSVCSAAHLALIRLLNDWSSLGNLLLPRDTLVKFSLETVKAVDESVARRDSQETFAVLWNQPLVSSFADVKDQYERMLKHLPDTLASKWLEDAGVAEVKAETDCAE